MSIYSLIPYPNFLSIIRYAPFYVPACAVRTSAEFRALYKSSLTGLIRGPEPGSSPAGVRSASEARRSPAAVGRKTKCAFPLGIAIPPPTRSVGPPLGAGIALAVARERSASVDRDPPGWRPRRAGSGESNAPSLPRAPLRGGRADGVERLRSAAATTRGGWVGKCVCVCVGGWVGGWVGGPLLVRWGGR